MILTTENMCAFWRWCRSFNSKQSDDDTGIGPAISEHAVKMCSSYSPAFLRTKKILSWGGGRGEGGGEKRGGKGKKTGYLDGRQRGIYFAQDHG